MAVVYERHLVSLWIDDEGPESDGVESLLSWKLSLVEYAWTTPADDGLYIMI